MRRLVEYLDICPKPFWMSAGVSFYGPRLTLRAGRLDLSYSIGVALDWVFSQYATRTLTIWNILLPYQLSDTISIKYGLNARTCTWMIIRQGIVFIYQRTSLFPAGWVGLGSNLTEARPPNHQHKSQWHFMHRHFLNGTLTEYPSAWIHV